MGVARRTCGCANEVELAATYGSSNAYLVGQRAEQGRPLELPKLVNTRDRALYKR